MSETVLISGINGLIGSHLCEHFLKNSDFRIVGFDKLTYASAGFDRIRDIECYDSNRVNIFTLDLASEISEGVIKETQDVSYILHLAAETHVDRSITDPISFVKSNVLGTTYFLQYARKLKNLKAFGFFSTDEVFGPALESVSYKEWDRYNSGNPYCLLKGTDIITYDGSTKKIENVATNDVVLSHDGTSTVRGHVVRNFKYVVNSIVSIKTDIGVLNQTKQHKYLVKRAKRYGSKLDYKQNFTEIEPTWIEAENIRKGDWIAHCSKIDIEPLKSYYDYNADFVKFLGFYAGNGYVRRTYSKKNDRYQYTIVLASEHKNFVEYYNSFLPNKGCVYKHKTKNCWYSQTGCLDMINRLKATSLYAKSRDKAIPSEILLGSETIVANFIGGLTDSDGSIDNVRKKISICTFFVIMIHQ